MQRMWVLPNPRHAEAAAASVRNKRPLMPMGRTMKTLGCLFALLAGSIVLGGLARVLWSLVLIGWEAMG